MDPNDRPSTLNTGDTPLSPDEIAPLVDNLANPDGQLRTASLSAIVTLSLTTESWHAVSGRLEPLLQAEADPESDLVEAAVHVPTLPVRALLHALTESIPEPAISGTLARALARDHDRAAIPLLLGNFRGENDDVRSMAVEHLSFFAVPEARDEFVRVAASDPDSATQFWSAVCLAQLGEPETLERDLTQSGLEMSLPFMWGDPQIAFARLQGRGPWPAASQSMLERLASQDAADSIVKALLAGAGDAADNDGQPDAVQGEHDPAKVADLRERALALRDDLNRTFPDHYDRSDGWEALAYLPEREAAALVSQLWRRLSKMFATQERTMPSVDSPLLSPWTFLAGGNDLVMMVSAMGSSFVPEIEPLFERFLGAQEHGQLTDQIGWTVGRAGMRPVLQGLDARLGSDDASIRLAATRLIEAAGIRARDASPPIYGGGAASARPRTVSLGFGGTPSMPNERPDSATEEGWTGSAPPGAAVEPAGEGDAAPPRPDLGMGSYSIGPQTGAAAATAAEPPMAGAGPPGPEGGPVVATDPPRTAYPHLQCPQVVTAGEEFDLEVGIAELRDPSVAGSEIVRPTWSQGPYVLTVWVLADGFSLRSGEVLRQHLAVTVEAPYPFALLHLTPGAQAEDIAHRKIEVTYFIGSQPVGIAYREVEVVRTTGMVTTTPLPPPPLTATFQIPADFTEPDLTVKISEGDKPGDLHWTFDTPGKSNVATPFNPIVTNIGRNPSEFATHLINRMNQSAGKALSLQMRGIGRAVTQATPTRFWEILASVAAGVGDRPPTLLIISQDPYVPWELALVDAPIDPGSAPFLGAQTVLGRWILPRIGQDKPDFPVQDPRMAGSMAILCGVYPEQRGRWKRLKHAEQEAADLKKHYEGVEVIADTSSVVDFLENPPEAEVFHFAGHAIYDPTSLENGLVLNDGTYLDATLISGAQFSPKPRPFVFLNACQAGSGYEVLGGYAGLVGALVTAGASAVVAPLWSVNDEEARKVSIEFYELTVDDEAPAEILRRQRARFGKDANGADVVPDSPVHLAYQFFGHPSMRLIRKHS